MLVGARTDDGGCGLGMQQFEGVTDAVGELRFLVVQQQADRVADCLLPHRSDVVAVDLAIVLLCGSYE